MPTREPPFAPKPPYGEDGEASLSGLTVPQAKAFNRLFVISFLIFVGIAVLAHIGAWSWRPWGHATEPEQVRRPPMTTTSMITVPRSSALAPALVLRTPALKEA